MTSWSARGAAVGAGDTFVNNITANLPLTAICTRTSLKISVVEEGGYWMNSLVGPEIGDGCDLLAAIF